MSTPSQLNIHRLFATWRASRDPSRRFCSCCTVDDVLYLASRVYGGCYSLRPTVPLNPLDVHLAPLDKTQIWCLRKNVGLFTLQEFKYVLKRVPRAHLAQMQEQVAKAWANKSLVVSSKDDIVPEQIKLVVPDKLDKETETTDETKEESPVYTDEEMPIEMQHKRMRIAAQDKFEEELLQQEAQKFLDLCKGPEKASFRNSRPRQRFRGRGLSHPYRQPRIYTVGSQQMFTVLRQSR